MLKTKVIAKWFPSSEHIDYGNKEANEARKRNPDLTLVPNIDEVIALRRTKFKLSIEGKKRFEEIVGDLSKEFDLDSEKITYIYSQHCGCTCPCSPGLKIITSDLTFKAVISKWSTSHMHGWYPLTNRTNRHTKSREYVKAYY